MRSLLLSTFFLVLALPLMLSAQRKYKPMVMVQALPDDTIYSYIGKPFNLVFRASAGAQITAPGTLETYPVGDHLVQCTCSIPLDVPTPEGEALNMEVCVGSGRDRYCDRVYIVACAPSLRLPLSNDTVAEWPGCRAQPDEVYDPTTRWGVDEIPASWYHTRVWFNDQCVFNRTGTWFTGALSEYDRRRLTPKIGTRIRTVVYFKPGGTVNEDDWTALLDTDTSQQAFIHPCNGVEVKTIDMAMLPRTVPEQRQYDTTPVLIVEAPLNDTLYWYAGVPARISFLATTGVEVEAPYKPEQIDQNQLLTRYSFTLPPQERTTDGGERSVSVCAGSGVQRYCDNIYVVADTPALVGASSGAVWPGGRTRVGEYYDPSTHWVAQNFPESWYHTRVWFNDQLVFDRAGTRIAGTLSHNERYGLIVSARVRIRTAVYFKPYATHDERMWSALLDTDTSRAALLHPCNGVEVVR